MLLLKVLGVSLVVVCCSFIGYLKSLMLVTRSRKLHLVLQGADLLYEYITSESCCLATALERAFCNCDFLCFENGVFTCDDRALKKEDTDEIENFFTCLGRSAKKSECDKIVNFKLKISELYNLAQQEVSKKSKVYRTFGICAGLTIGILLI